METILSAIDSRAMQSNEISRIYRLIEKSEAELDKINRFKVNIYEDYTDGLIKKKDYVDMKHIYDERSKETKMILGNLQNELEHFENNISPESEWINRFKKYQSSDILTRDLLISLVDQILIYEDKKIEIKFKYQNAFNRALSYIESITDDNIQKSPFGEVI